MKRFKIEELEGKALENALKDTAMYNDIEDLEDTDAIMEAAEENGYEFNEEGERLKFYNGRWMTFTEYTWAH